MDKISPQWDPSYPKYNIDRLHPPNISRLYGKTERDFDLKELKILFNHYGWGFRSEHTRGLKADKFRILAKIIHYTKPNLRPSHEDFEKCTSDAGPGLLRPECGALPFTLRHPPPSRDQPMDEYFRKAMLQFPYRSLERSPSDFPILPTAAENSPIQRTEQGVIEDRYRGRGPTGDGGFDGVLYCALDCALVAARLLDAGCTKADRANPYWHRMLSDLEKTFLELVWRNWGDDLDKHIFYPAPKQLRDSLSEHAATLKHKIIEDLKTGQTVANKRPIKSVWESCTKSFGQFLVRYDQHSKHHYPCGSSNEPTSSSARCIPLKANRRDPSKNTIEAQMAGFFTDNYWTKCDGCERLAKEEGYPQEGDRTNATKGHIETQRRFHELPLRLAFMTDPNAWPGSHTASNIVINYRDWNDKCERATYRWLGGIYPIEQHNCCRYVVFWNDHERYETDYGKFRKYDAQIIRGLSSMGNDSERVPLSDLQRGQPALLFYEQVVNPPQNYIQEVQDAITRSMESVHQSESVTTPAGNQTSSRTSPTNVGVGIPPEGPQQGIAILEDYDYPEGVASYQPTNPQFKRGPQQPSYQLSPMPPSSSRAQLPRTTEAFRYESRSPQSQRDAERLYQTFLPGQIPSSYTSVQYPGGLQRRLTPPQPAQINPLSSHRHSYSYPAGQYGAPEPDISAPQTTVTPPGHLPPDPPNEFDHLLDHLGSLPNPFQAQEDVQSIDPRPMTTFSTTHTPSWNISPVNAASRSPQSYQNHSLSQFLPTNPFKLDLPLTKLSTPVS